MDPMEFQYWSSVNQKTVGELFQCESNKLCWFYPDDSLERVLKVLKEQSFLSAPIMKDDELIGMIDYLDIGCYIADNTHHIDTILSEPVFKAMNYSTINCFFPLYVGSPLSALIKILSTTPHRCPVNNEHGKFYSIITQSDVISFLSERKYAIASMANKKIKDEFVHPIIKINEKATLIECLKLLKQNKVHALALVDDDNCLVGTFSSSDIKNLTTHNIASSLDQPVSKVVNSSLSWPVCVSPTESLEQVIEKLLSNDIHRVWIVGSNNEPIGVISLTDIMKKMLIYFPDIE
eukprot:TRINITY_DN11403_c0_g1_i1.p1 TRINITY_DN11403_c0_g1~~TRINITY_DN11403_c0_g1_i1.p1  ORF type:complete len:292 (+),score=37.84 TRINITY_DN11403_c0_g1_i1:81-956(+)